MRDIEPGMHTRGHASDAAWSRHMRKLGQVLFSEAATELDSRSRKERLIQKAQGHPDRSDVQAARNICQKNGWEF
jgi:hypothetical protein